MVNNNNSSRLIFGLALVILGLLLILPRGGVVNQSETFANEPIKVEGFNFEEREEIIPKRIIIPDLAIDLIVNKAYVKNGYWEVFPDSAGWGEGSGIPGHPGNQVIFAHAKEGLFLPLHSIKVGTNIYILTEDDWYLYKTFDITEVLPSETNVIAPTEDEILTLYTCSGFQDSKRLIVAAKRI